MKIYAVRIGHFPGVYNNWPDAKRQVDGFPGAKYKSFSAGQFEAAKRYLNQGVPAVITPPVTECPAPWRVISDSPPLNTRCLVAYLSDAGEETIFPGVVVLRPEGRWEAPTTSVVLSRYTQFVKYMVIPDWA